MIHQTAENSPPRENNKIEFNNVKQNDGNVSNNGFYKRHKLNKYYVRS